MVASAAAANGEGAAKDEAQPVDAASELSFRDGIDQPLAAAIPATRAADQPPAHDVEVDRNVDASAAQVAKAAASQKSSKPRSKVSAAPKTQAAPAGKFTLVIKTTTLLRRIILIF